MEPNRETPQPNATAPHEQPAMLRITLASISDGVITTDTKGLVTFLNPVAESVTGWTQADAVGLPLEKIFKIINEESRHTVENPVTRTLRESKVVGLVGGYCFGTETHKIAASRLSMFESMVTLGYVSTGYSRYVPP